MNPKGRNEANDRTAVRGRPLPPADPRPVVIEPAGRVRLNLAELWEYRDLLYFLMWRDVKVRYKQTIIGSAWAIIQPVLTMLVFTVFFGHVVKVPTGDVPYPLFSYSALVPWTYFTHALTTSIASMVNDQALVTQVYVPRPILPVSAVLGGMVDFAIAFVILLLMMVYYGVTPSWALLTLPLFTALIIATAVGIGLWLAPLNAQFRDVANAVPFLIQLWLFATPVAYPSELIPDPWRLFYGLNPMAGVVEGFRWALLGDAYPPPGPMTLVSIGAVGLLLAGGMYFFRRREEILVDVV